MTLAHVLGGPFAGCLEWLLRASLSATFIAALILLVQIAFGRWLSPAWRHRLWAVMVVRLMLPVLPASPASLSNFDLLGHIRRGLVALRNDHTSDRTPGESPTAAIASVGAQRPKVTVIYGAPPMTLGTPVSQAMQPPSPVHEPPARLPAILLFVWLAGVAALLARLLGANLRLARRLRHAAGATDTALLGRFRECCRRAQIRRPPELLMTDAVRIPATAGAWRPRILLPPGLFEGLSDQQQRSVLLHELAHAKCRDVLSNWALAAAQIIHWFNPAIRWAIGRLKVDREMARDAMVLRWIAGEDAAVGREQYARTLLNLTETLSAGPRCLGMVAGLAGICMPAGLFRSGGFGRGSALKRRLQMIRTCGPVSRGSTLLGSLLAAALVSCTLTRAQDRPAPPHATNPPPPTVEERQAVPSRKDDTLAAEARDLIAQHRYEEALTIVNQIRLENPQSKFVAEVEPTLRKQMKVEEERAKAKMDALQKRLDMMLPELSFDAVGFSDVIDFLRDASGTSIIVNWKSIEAANIKQSVPITARLRNVRFSKGLSIILDAAGAGRQKLGYTIGDGVITISTADDLGRNVQVRVYDIRDLLTVPPDFVPLRLGTPQPTAASVPTTAPSVKTVEQSLRDQMVKDLIQTIEGTVTADSWMDSGGSVGALRELQGQLIVTQTFDNQIQIMQLLQQLRESRGMQCTVNCRFVSCDEPVARALLAKWQKIATPATLHAGATAQPGETAAVGLFLDEEQVAQFLRAGEDAPKLSEIGAPRLTLFNGQRAYVMVGTSRAYTSDYAAVTAAGGQIRYDPVVSVVQSGLLMDVQATISADRTAATLSLRPQISALLGMKQLPWPGRPAGSNLMVQDPQVRSTELQTTVSVPDGRTLLLGGMEDPRVPDDSAAATRPDRPLRSLFLLVKPKVIVGAVGEQKQFPLLTQPIGR